MKQKDFLLIPFPFSDQLGKKVRPVIVVSGEKYNFSSNDLVVIGVSSKKFENSLILKNDDLSEGKFFVDSFVKVDNVLKIEKGLVIKKIGVILDNKFDEILNNLLKIFD